MRTRSIRCDCDRRLDFRPCRWLGIAEVDDGRRHFGAVFDCDFTTVPETMCNEEIDGLALWTPAAAPEPLGQTDRALLGRFARAGLPKPG